MHAVPTLQPHNVANPNNMASLVKITQGLSALTPILLIIIIITLGLCIIMLSTVFMLFPHTN